MSPLSREEQRWLLELARRAIAAQLSAATLDLAEVSKQSLSPQVRQPAGAFVTLNRQGELRGCIGAIQSQKPLFQTVAGCALAAAFRDARFPPLPREELEGVEIEISVLSPLFDIRPEEVRVGEHGLLVTQGFQRGLLLPQVASEHGWTPEQFLEETCAKAGLARDAWKKGARLEAFTAVAFSDAGEPPRRHSDSPQP